MEPYRFVGDHACYFVTFTIVEWIPVFTSATTCQIIADSLNFCHHHKALRTNAFVIMPTHMHAILFDADLDDKRFVHNLADFRKYTGRQLADHCSTHLPVFDQVLRAAAGQDRKRRFWQETRHPEAIYSQGFWQQKLDYLHDNPRRKGLVRLPEHWRFSSAAYWSGDPAASDVVLSPLPW